MVGAARTVSALKLERASAGRRSLTVSRTSAWSAGMYRQIPFTSATRSGPEQLGEVGVVELALAERAHRAPRP
jgi:hypothetical protein